MAFFLAVFFGGRLAIELFLPATKDLAAPRAVQRYVIIVVAEVIVAPATRTLSLECFVATNDAVPILDLVAAKSRANGAALRDGHRDSLALAAQPARGIDRGTAVANLEVEMWWQIGIRDADSAELLALGHALMQVHVGSREGAVD